MNKSDLIKKISDRKDYLNEDDISQTIKLIVSLVFSVTPFGVKT